MTTALTPLTRAWLKWNQVRFKLLPVERRVSLMARRDGRHLTYLLTALAEAGYGVQTLQSPVLFRELMDLAKAVSMPFMIGGPEQGCGLVIQDKPIDGPSRNGARVVELDYDFFNTAKTDVRMAYFMHPFVYRQGLHRSAAYSLAEKRPVRLGFYGTYDKDFYTQSFIFPMLNRIEILDLLLAEYGAKITHLGAEASTWTSCAIAVSIDYRGGDQPVKDFLPMRTYFQALQASDFLLAPPGYLMPHSHNLVEGMSRGSIPVMNYPEQFTPPLRDGEECITFATKDELRAKINQILAMPDEEVMRMRRAVRAYYNTYLDPKAWAKANLASLPDQSRLLVNSEEISVRLLRGLDIGSPDA